MLNAGVEGGRAPTASYPTAEVDRVMAVNVRGTWLGLKHLLPLLLAARGDPPWSLLAHPRVGRCHPEAS